MYREFQDEDGKSRVEVKASINIQRSANLVHDFLLSTEHVTQIIGHHFTLINVAPGQFKWIFDGPLMLDFEGAGIMVSKGNTMTWKAADTHERTLDLKLEFRRIAHATHVDLACQFDHPGKVLAALLETAMGVTSEDLAKQMLLKLKELVEAETPGQWAQL